MSEAPAAVAQRTDATVAEVAEEIRAADRFLLTTHEGPDGDALGSLLATHKLLQQLGKDSVMFLAAKEFPLPVEYRFLRSRKCSTSRRSISWTGWWFSSTAGTSIACPSTSCAATTRGF